MTVGGGGIARAVGVEDRDGIDRADVVDGHVLRQHVHIEPASGEVQHGRLLDAEVEDGEVPEVRDALGGGGDLGGGHRHLRRQVPAGHLGRLADDPQLLVRVDRRGVAGEDRAAHAAGGAEHARHRAGVDAADADDAVAFERVVEGLLRAPVRHDSRGIAHDVAGDPDAARLDVLAVHAGVPDVRRGLQNDLPGVGGIGEGLLVAGHPGGEHHFAERRPARTVGTARVAGAVLEDEHGGVEGRREGAGHASDPVGVVGVGAGRMPATASARAPAEASCGRK